MKLDLSLFVFFKHLCETLLHDAVRLIAGVVWLSVC